MKKRHVGNYLILGFVLLNLVLWGLFPPQNTLKTNYSLQFAGEVIASTAMVMIAITLVLASRRRFLEPIFGGLDQIWQAHKKIAMGAFLLLILHFFTIPKTETLINGKPIGMLSFLGMVILVLLTVAPRIPVISRILNLNYTVWRLVHKLMGIFFILGFVHYILVDTISVQTIPGMYMLLWTAIGVVAFLYRQFFSRLFEPYREYIVEQVNRLNGTCVEISLAPREKKRVKFKAGQFGYIAFKAHHLREPHPFTISSSPKEEKLRITIKASGDWTRYLNNNLKPETTAKVLGGFGMFNYKEGGTKQIWIAGGIGVTPFVSWIRDFDGKPDLNVDFYYGLHSEDDALYLKELQSAARQNTNFNLNVRYAVREGHLSAEEILSQYKNNESDICIYMCGPIGMMESFTSHFKKAGVPAGNIRYEEFNLR